jgi:hypothetical protein
MTLVSSQLTGMEATPTTEDIQGIQNRVEGPQYKVVVHCSANEYLKHWGTGEDPYAYPYEKIMEQLPEGELKKAFIAGYNEQEARRKAGLGALGSPILTDEAKKYAFRGIRRRSDNLPTWQHPEATLESVDDSLHANGIDAPGERSPYFIMPGLIWNIYAFPNATDVRKHNIDVSGILVYRNEPFVLPSQPGAVTTKLYTGDGSKAQEISLDQAKNYPTLRDIYIGQIEVHYDKPKWRIPNFFKR